MSSLPFSSAVRNFALAGESKTQKKANRPVPSVMMPKAGNLISLQVRSFVQLRATPTLEEEDGPPARDDGHVDLQEAIGDWDGAVRARLSASTLQRCDSSSSVPRTQSAKHASGHCRAGEEGCPEDELLLCVEPREHDEEGGHEAALCDAEGDADADEVCKVVDEGRAGRDEAEGDDWGRGMEEGDDQSPYMRPREMPGEGVGVTGPRNSLMMGIHRLAPTRRRMRLLGISTAA